MALLRFATLNLLHGMPPHGPPAREADLRAAAKMLDADLIGLQEVDRHQPRSGHLDQAEAFADETGAPWWRFVPTLSGPLGAHRPAGSDTEERAGEPGYGLALVSRLPVLEWHCLRFAASPLSLPLYDSAERRLIPLADEPRVAVAAVVVGPDGPFTAATVHLSFVPGRNIVQLRRTVRWLSRLPGPRFLLGDLNLPGRLPGALSRWNDLAHAPTYPAWKPRVQWDHVLADALGPAQVVCATAEQTPISDHRGLRVDLAW